MIDIQKPFEYAKRILEGPKSETERVLAESIIDLCITLFREDYPDCSVKENFIKELKTDLGKFEIRSIKLSFLPDSRNYFWTVQSLSYEKGSAFMVEIPWTGNPFTEKAADAIIAEVTRVFELPPFPPFDEPTLYHWEQGQLGLVLTRWCHRPQYGVGCGSCASCALTLKRLREEYPRKITLP